MVASDPGGLDPTHAAGRRSGESAPSQVSEPQVRTGFPPSDPKNRLRDTIRHLVELNVVAITLLTHAAIIRMRTAGQGTIISVASAAAYQPTPRLGAYGTSKSFVLILTEAVSEENRAPA